METENSKRSKRDSSVSRRVLKVMSIFTSVEMAGIICAMVKMKLVALWLDATGVGLFNIFNSTVETATYLTGLGVRQSAVRDISLANKRGEQRLKKVISAVRGWSVVAGMLGAVCLCSLALPLSDLILGDSRMWWCFVVLGGTMLVNAIYAGEIAIFQATEQFRRIARTALEMAITGLLVSIPMFRFMGNASVAWSIISYSLLGLIFAVINKDRRFPIRLPDKQTLFAEKSFLKFGAYISITAFINSLCQLAFSSWLNRTASTAEVGLYAAGFTLVVRYTSLVFNSVGLEFYPRAASCMEHPRRLEVFMNHEITLLLMIFTPLMLLFMAFREWIVMLLYDRDFLIILPFISWGIMTVLLRSVSNTLGYTVMARGEGKVYMLTDSIDAILGLILSIWLYTRMGLVGIGIAMVIWYSVYLLIVEGVCRLRYGLRLRRDTLLSIGVSGLCAVLSLISVIWLPKLIYIPIFIIVAIVYFYSFLRFIKRHGH